MNKTVLLFSVFLFSSLGLIAQSLDKDGRSSKTKSFARIDSAKNVQLKGSNDKEVQKQTMSASVTNQLIPENTYIAGTLAVGPSFTGTETIAMNIHNLTGDTPGIRLDQSNSSGWEPYIWDIAGNEANFFIRDVTDGDKLPFRIEYGAPTNTLTLHQQGFVGVGTYSPVCHLDVNGIIKVGNNLSFTNFQPGMIRFRNSIFEGYNGTSWTTFATTNDIITINTRIDSLVNVIELLKSTTGYNSQKSITSSTLAQNTPNPFNATTSIDFYLPHSVGVAYLHIYDLAGKEVKKYYITGREKGHYLLSAKDLYPGLFLYSLIADGKIIETKKLTIIE